MFLQCFRCKKQTHPSSMLGESVSLEFLSFLLSPKATGMAPWPHSLNNLTGFGTDISMVSVRCSLPVKKKKKSECDHDMMILSCLCFQRSLCLLPVPFVAQTLHHGCPTFWLAWATLSEELLRVPTMKVVLKVMPSNYFCVNCN